LLALHTPNITATRAPEIPPMSHKSASRLDALKQRLSGSPTASTRSRADDVDKDEFEADLSSPHHLRALMHTRSPWADRELSLMTPMQYSSALDSCYANFQSLQRARLFRAKLGDVIVSGVQRCGQTPTLLILDALRRRAMHAKRREICERSEWIEAAYPQPVLVPEDPPHRLLKSNLTLRALLSENYIEGKVHSRAKDFKVVCVLRDPVMVRKSWYEHARRVFRFFHRDAAWDFTADDWCAVPVANYRMSVDTVAYDYEHYILEVIECVHLRHPNICVVFYEDLICHPREFVSALQQFTGLGDEAMARVVADKIVAEDGNHPMSDARSRGLSVGHLAATKTSTQSPRGGGGGFMVSSRGTEYASLSQVQIDSKWDSIIRPRHKELVGYEALYEQLSGRKWPYGSHRIHAADHGAEKQHA
jgi:hypothetical protein